MTWDNFKSLAPFKCEQNCPNDAECLILDDDTLFVVCGQHEGELMCLEGQSNLKTFYFQNPDWLNLAKTAINEYIAFKTKKYVKLLDQYSKLAKPAATIQGKAESAT